MVTFSFFSFSFTFSLASGAWAAEEDDIVDVVASVAEPLRRALVFTEPRFVDVDEVSPAFKEVGLVTSSASEDLAWAVLDREDDVEVDVDIDVDVVAAEESTHSEPSVCAARLTGVLRGSSSTGMVGGTARRVPNIQLKGRSKRAGHISLVPIPAMVTTKARCWIASFAKPLRSPQMRR